MSPPLQSIQSDPALPESVDVAIIGGGIIGVSTAYALARKGLRVAVFEKGHIGAEQSSRNWGWVRQQSRDPRELALSKMSLSIWDGLAEAAGADLGFRRAGLIYMTDNPEQLATWEAWSRMAKDHGIESIMLTAEQTHAAAPGAQGKWIGGVSCPSDGRAEPSLAAPLIGQAARKLGATLHQTCAVRGLETSAGRVSAVVTEKGRVKASSVVLAGGAWSSMFCGAQGINLPSGNVQGTAMRTEVAPEVTAGTMNAPGFCLRRRLDGSYTLALAGRGTWELTPRGIRYAREFMQTFKARRKGLKYTVGRSFFEGPGAFTRWRLDEVSPFEKFRVLDPAPDMAIVREAIAALHTTYPALSGVKVAQAWAGVIDTMADAIPVISPVEKLPGLVLSTGYSGHGFGTGPGAGQLTADLVTGDAPVIDPHAFRYSRLIDGTDLGKPGAL